MTYRSKDVIRALPFCTVALLVFYALTSMALSLEQEPDDCVSVPYELSERPVCLVVRNE